jgi:predicted nucleic acid-binding protein
MKKEIVFLDANILFSVAYGSTGLNNLWELSRKGICVLLASQYVIEEAKRNLAGRVQLGKLDSYLSSVEVVNETDPHLPCPIDLPEKDIPVLMAAVSSGANYLITGDIPHFGKYFGKAVMGVEILMARDYLQSRMPDSRT